MASAVLSLVLKERQEAKLSGKWKQTSFAEAFLSGTGQAQGASTTCVKSVPDASKASISSAEDSRVRMYLQQVDAWASKVAGAAFGRSSCASFASYNQSSWWSKTFEDYSMLPAEELVPFSGPWPSSGLMLGGVSFRLKTLELRTGETGCSSSRGRLWPTATVGGATNRPAPGTKRGMGLRSAVQDCGDTGPLNPTWVEQLMGFPSGWTDGLHVQAIRKGRGKPRARRTAERTKGNE